MSCCICIEKFNLSTRSKVKCEYCNYEDACKSCWKQFLLSIPERARCMNDTCRKKWTYTNLINQFDRTFVDKTYKSHIETIMYNQEKSLLPSTQTIIEIEKLREEYTKQIREYIRQIDTIEYKIRQLDNNPAKQQRTFIKKCPNEKCNGFLSTQWKCGLCDTKVCSECHEIKTHDEHKCDPSTVETVKLLKNDCKNCPSCSTVIYRISGCDQMFCTHCNTTFSWNTLRIETGVIHNPHYFEWKRKQGTFHEDIPCGREIDHQFIIYYDRHFQKHIYTYKNRIENGEIHLIEKMNDMIRKTDDFRMMCMNSIHMRHVVLRELNDNRQRNNEDLRLKFLKGEIDEPKFKSLIQMRDKKMLKNEEISQVLTMFVNAFTDIIYRIKEVNILKEETDKVHDLVTLLLTEVYCLLEYTNACFKKISDIYKCRHLAVDKRLIFTGDRHRYIN